MPDYSGSFSGSYQGNGNQLTNIDYYNLSNLPTTVTPFQKNSILANNSVRDNFVANVKVRLSAESVISSSAQLTTEFDARYGNEVGDNLISGSSQIASLLPAGTISGSSQLPNGLVSGSSQITITQSQISNLSHYTDANVKSKLNTENIISSSAQISASAAASGFGSGGGAANQSLSLSGNSLTISAGNTISLSGLGGGGAGGSSIWNTGSQNPDSYTHLITNNDLKITGSVFVSESINAHNVNVGTPTSNDWQANLGGSYFNNFTKDTDVSEVLRFVAGLLSSSAANPTANSKTLGSVSETKTNTGTSVAVKGLTPQNTNKNDTIYLIERGFASVGGEHFPGKTIYTNTGYNVKYNSVAGGSTTVSSSNDSQLIGMGILNSGGASSLAVKGTHAFRFNNNNSGTQTETSASTATITNSSFGTSNGVTIAKIGTANPAVIPAAFQDGKFVGVHAQNIMGWTTEANTSVSASGTYILNTTIGIKTGSQSTFIDSVVSETAFWAPISTLNATMGLNSITTSGNGTTAKTATSSSLSGAPYLSGGTYEMQATASGVFQPMYMDNNRIVDVSIGSTNGYTITKSSGLDTLSTAGGTIQTSGMVTNAGGSVARNSGVPSLTDQVNVKAIYTISGTGNTISESGFSDTSFTLGLRAKNREGTQSTLNTQTVSLHTAGTFGQASGNGSMGYFGGGTASTSLIERFTNETYRRVISTSTALVNAWNSGTTLSNGDGEDLQVKPGYLVNNESANGYWYDDSSYNAAHYKWYLKEVDTNATSNKGTLTINMNPNSSADFVNFDSTTANKIAVGVMFGSTASTIFDAVKGNQSYGGSLNTTANGAMNPFSDSVAVKGDFSSITNSGGTLTLGLNNAGGQTINASNDKIWLLIRYKGTPSQTLEQITVSVT